MASINYKTILLFFLLSVFEATVDSYHAVVLIHGILTGSDSMELISNRIEEVSSQTWNKECRR